jgi:hypothetical protein
MWYTITVPHIYTEIGPEFHHVADLFERFEWIEKKDRYLLMKRWDKDRPDGHPMDWPFPTRLMWYKSHIRKIVYRPVDEDHDAAEDYQEPGLKEVTEALRSLYIWDFPRVFSNLDTLCLDMREWESEDGSTGDGVYWDDEGLGYGMTWDEDGYYFDNPDIDEYGNINGQPSPRGATESLPRLYRQFDRGSLHLR